MTLPWADRPAMGRQACHGQTGLPWGRQALSGSIPKQISVKKNCEAIYLCQSKCESRIARQELTTHNSKLTTPSV